MTNHFHIKKLIEKLFRITGELEATYDRPFTPDGHLVGSLGEVIAANAFGLILEPPSTKGFDAKNQDGKRIEIKATFGNRVAFRRHDADDKPDYCLVLKLKRDASFDEIYNGPMKPVDDDLSVRTLPSNGQVQVTLTYLTAKNRRVNDADRLYRVDR